MGYEKAVSVCYKKYATFKGRASRSEFWWFNLHVCLMMILAMVGEYWFGTDGILYCIVCLVLILPSLSCSVRRLHDKDKSGWWLLVEFIPLIGGIVLLVWFISVGNFGKNHFGDDPLQQTPTDSTESV